MARLLQIAELGQPILRQKAENVKNPLDPSVLSLIDDLTGTIMDANGVGLSAPQVYESTRVAVIASHPSPRYPDAPTVPPFAIINPVITASSKTIKSDWEGCLSIPGIRGFVPRCTSISIEYTDREGKAKKESYDTFLARIIQHEVDHLDGILFLDRITYNTDLISEKEYQKMIRSKKF